MPLYGGIRVIVRTAQGTYRHRRGKITTKWPMLVQNPVDKQSYILSQEPVFLLDKEMLEHDSWEDFIEAPPPMEEIDGDPHILVEDNAFWPIPRGAVPTSEEVQLGAQGIYEEAVQQAVAQAAREAAMQRLLSMAFSLLVGVSVLFTLILGSVVVNQVWLSD